MLTTRQKALRYDALMEKLEPLIEARKSAADPYQRASKSDDNGFRRSFVFCEYYPGKQIAEFGGDLCEESAAFYILAANTIQEMIDE